MLVSCLNFLNAINHALLCAQVLTLYISITRAWSRHKRSHIPHRHRAINLVMCQTTHPRCFFFLKLLFFSNLMSSFRPHQKWSGMYTGPESAKPCMYTRWPWKLQWISLLAEGEIIDLMISFNTNTGLLLLPAYAAHKSDYIYVSQRLAYKVPVEG